MTIICRSLREMLLCLIDDGTTVLWNDKPEYQMYGFVTYKGAYFLPVKHVKERQLSGNSKIDELFQTGKGRIKMTFLLNDKLIFKSGKGVDITFPSGDKMQKLESVINVMMM